MLLSKTAISPFALRSSSVETPLNPILNPFTPTVLLDFRADDSANFELTGTDVDEWFNVGANGVNATESTNKPVYNAAENCLTFTSENQDRLNIETPVALDSDTGWTMLIGFKQLSNDTYVFGSTNSSGARLFLRNTGINVQFSATNSRIFNYSGWDTKKTGRAILELTHLGSSGVMEARINNGVLSNGNSGTAGIENTFFDQIGCHDNLSFWNGQIAFIYLQNKPFSTDDRAEKYAEFSAIYVPE